MLSRTVPLPAVLAACWALSGAACPAAEDIWRFDDSTIGSLPGGFESAVGEWKVAEDPSAPSGTQVLAQLERNDRPAFNVVLLKGKAYGDVDISVRLRSVSGEIDQGGGLVWRAKDAKNYYIARYNPLEGNYRVYKVNEGKRTQLGSADIARAEGWHEVRVVMKAGRIQCLYDGKAYLDVSDGTFKEAGRIGLWTKADAVTRFDDLRARELREGAETPAGRRERALADMKAICDCAKMRFVSEGMWPESIGAMVRAKEESGEPAFASLEKIPKDPWGNDYVYAVVDGHVRVLCLGSDGAEGGEGEACDLAHPGKDG